MSAFSINSCTNIGITYLDEMVDTIETKLPVLREAWENLDPYTKNNRWRPALDPNLESIGTGHYTLLKSLNYIRKNKDLVKMNDPEQRFKNIYFHFGLIIDCIKQLSRSILLFETKLGMVDFHENSYSSIQVVQKVEKWYDENYRTYFRKLVTNGVAISVPLQPEKDYVSLLGSKKALEPYNKFKIAIQPYRNIFIHNPAVDIFKIRGFPGEFVVKKEVLKNCRFLNEIDKTDKSNIINPKIMVNQDYSECLQVITSICAILLSHIKEINSHPEFIHNRDNK